MWGEKHKCGISCKSQTAAMSFPQSQWMLHVAMESLMGGFFLSFSFLSLANADAGRDGERQTGWYCVRGRGQGRDADA